MRITKSAAAILLLLPVSVSAASLDKNLIKNPGGEASTGSSSYSVEAKPASWNTTGKFSVIKYSIGTSGDINSSDGNVIGGGKNFFGGGPTGANSSAFQDIDVSNLASQIDSGSLTADLSGYLGGFSSQNDRMTVTADFFSGGSSLLQTLAIGPVTNSNRSNISKFLFRNASSAVPAGTRRVRITMFSVLASGFSVDGYADNLDFRISAKGPKLQPNQSVAAPKVQVNQSKKSITVQFQSFSGAVVGPLASPLVTGEIQALPAKSNTGKVIYVLNATNQANGLLKTAITNKTKTELKLDTGTYSVNYQAFGTTQIKGKKAAKRKKKANSKLQKLNKQVKLSKKQFGTASIGLLNQKEQAKKDKKFATKNISTQSKVSPTVKVSIN